MFGRLRQLCRALGCASPADALAAPPPTAVVTMGDGYISGEAGRWFGNSANVAGSRDGTDRACRAVSASTIAQGEIQELFHPNAYGQMALGTCVGALYAARPGSYACTNVAPRGPGDMVLTALRDRPRDLRCRH